MSIRVLIDRRSFRLEHVTTNLMSKRTGRIVQRHRHPVFHLMYITDGSGKFHINDRESTAAPGHLYIINPDEWHEFHGNEAEPLTNLESTFFLLDENNEPSVVNFFDWVEEKRGLILPDTFRQGPISVPTFLRPFLIEGFHRILEYRKFHFSSEYVSVMVIDLLMRVEETIARIRGTSTDTLSKSKDSIISILKYYISAHLGEPFTLKQLSELVHITPNYLCRMFKEHTGETPMGYLQRIRMMEAEKLLLYTDLPVYSIAEKLGYDDASYFARVFRLHFDRAPTEFRIK